MTHHVLKTGVSSAATKKTVLYLHFLVTADFLVETYVTHVVISAGLFHHELLI